MQTLTIEFDNTGSPTIEVKGVKGVGCKALTAALEADFGTEKTSKPTREMQEAAPRTVNQARTI